MGLAGVWGGIIRQWLEELLPADAAERCNGCVGGRRMSVRVVVWLGGGGVQMRLCVGELCAVDVSMEPVSR